ncbi:MULTISPECIES: glyoxalase/bleomycin resistance/dioxygenase family protein [Caballeronia]|uniref:glyoxalase/bleomycin resistance/dioxygenase family protein n=1 Tax=Caballeronia TaxID=1827195 RepID=UPI00023876E8|nr:MULTISPECIES: glyoxalase/bleomycin resistance/dioxygenase family protein [unclassified Caballeronia]AET94670.1 Superfamily II DNA helicase [Burkholderia sp. YI23]BAO91187.1 superfamily II DNA helicase [Burkholderia sp. RPE67]BBQ01415.1 hypothetical protein BSFA1_65430 [Burkholderia sp. SFA1]MCE4546135.1 glyoxalase/bleomycin resistance/dioxygenase family protein [Caballeronia sp. PC1]MCE4573390.1 glyoxalase/bleomycin resistance/dioxygenase family protein [Caballeronia sp. CLC5]
MFIRDGVTYEFHHMGIPTREPRAGERYSAQFRMYTSDAECELMHVQYHRFEEGSALPELMRTVPHAAFKVSDLAKAVQGHVILLGPYEPIDGFRVAVIRDGEAPVELIETTLTDEEIWGRAKSGTQSSMYRRE